MPSNKAFSEGLHAHAANEIMGKIPTKVVKSTASDPAVANQINGNVPSKAYIERCLTQSATNNIGNRPTIVLIHGGYQTSEAYSLLAPLLSKAKYRVLTPDLPSTTRSTTVPDFSADVEVVRGVLEDEVENGNSVVVVMHSYGAVVGCEAVKNVMVKAMWIESMTNGVVKGGLMKLMFIAGYTLPVGGACCGRNKEPLQGMVLGTVCQTTPLIGYYALYA